MSCGHRLPDSGYDRLFPTACKRLALWRYNRNWVYMAMNRVYMDANATTPLVPEVLAAMRPWFEEKFGNPSSIHFNGQQARSAVDHARESIAAMLSCRPAEVVFT